MHTFSTPNPIDLAIHLSVGMIEVFATDRTDTVVTVSPTNPSKMVDRRGAEDTRVDFEGERLTIRGPKPRFSITGPYESVDLRIELPTSSRLTADLSSGAVNTTGRLGATRIKAAQVDLDTTGDLWLRALHGHVVVGSAEGSAEITADHGQVRIGTIGGDAIIKASHGSVTIGECTGDLEAKLSYGDFEITKSVGSVSAKTAYGRIDVHELCAGSNELDTAYGQITVGVREGVAAWLDLLSKQGRVRNDLDADSAPGASDPSLAVRARTQFGDITVRRAS